jgi:hypothetical protein
MVRTTEEFLKKLAPCIQRGEPEACVDEAVRIAGEMGIEAAQLLDLSSTAGASGRHDLAYALALAAAQELAGKENCYI